MRRRHAFAFAVSMLFTACADLPDPSQDAAVGESTAAVVNDEDDRREVFEAGGGAAGRANQSSVALMDRRWGSQLVPSQGGRYQLIPGAPTLDADGGIQYPDETEGTLCAGERFGDQPTVAYCSGVLIGDDLVLTAGHCFQDQDCKGCSDDKECLECCLKLPSSCATPDERGIDRCQRFDYVFDYSFSRRGQGADLSDLEVYGCRKVVACEKRCLDGGFTHDFAIVQLDRKVQRSPAPVRWRHVAKGEKVTVIGYPVGLPAKVDAGGRVQTVGPSTWTGTTDTFHGNSGSPAFDANFDLVGILSSGRGDFVKVTRDGKECGVVNRLEPKDEKDEKDKKDPYGTERFVHPAQALVALCETPEGRDRSLCRPQGASVEGEVALGCAVGTRSTQRSGLGGLAAGLLGLAVARRRRARLTG